MKTIKQTQISITANAKLKLTPFTLEIEKMCRYMFNICNASYILYFLLYFVIFI